MSDSKISKPVSLTNVLHVPDLRTNLMSVSKITEKGYVTFERGFAIITDRVSNVKYRYRKDSLYYIRKSVNECTNAL